MSDVNQVHPTIKFIYEISDTEVTFLDVTLYKGERFKSTNILDLKIHIKATNKQLYVRSGCLYTSRFDFKKCRALGTPSSCGIFEYRDDTSIEASLQFADSLVALIWLINSVVSLTYEGRFFTYGCSH